MQNLKEEMIPIFKENTELRKKYKMNMKPPKFLSARFELNKKLTSKHRPTKKATKKDEIKDLILDEDLTERKLINEN